MIKYINRLWKEVFLGAIKSYNDDRIPTFAASISFFAIFSIAPILVLVILSIGLVLGSTESYNNIIAQVNSALGSEATSLIKNLINSVFNSQGQLQAIFVAIFGFGLAIIGLLDQMDIAFCSIWKIHQNRSFTKTLQYKLVQVMFVFLNIGIILFSIVTSNTINSLLSQYRIISWLLTKCIELLSVSLVIGLILEFLVSEKVKSKAVVFGSIVTALILLVGQSVINWYLVNYAGVSAYGAAGSLVIILLWVNFISQIVLYGAKVTRLYQSFIS